MSDAHKGNKNHNYGVPKSEEIKKKISESNKGRYLSEETRKKISEVQKGKRVGEKSPCAKSVAQYDLNGNLIHVWGCITQAAKELGVNRQHISACCKRKKGRKTVGGFIWQYVNNKTTQNDLKDDKNAI